MKQTVTAQMINEHLKSGGRVQVTTYGRSTIYDSRHAGWFENRSDGFLYVGAGRKFNCLSNSNGLLVGIRFSAK